MLTRWYSDWFVIFIRTFNGWCYQATYNDYSCHWRLRMSLRYCWIRGYNDISSSVLMTLASFKRLLAMWNIEQTGIHLPTLIMRLLLRLRYPVNLLRWNASSAVSYGLRSQSWRSGLYHCGRFCSSRRFWQALVDVGYHHAMNAKYIVFVRYGERETACASTPQPVVHLRQEELCLVGS